MVEIVHVSGALVILHVNRYFCKTFAKLMPCIDVNAHVHVHACKCACTYMHVLVRVGWGRVEDGCGINFL